MPQHLTCPHCENALSIEDEVTANVSCPRCLALIPHGGLDGGIVQARDAEAMEGEARRCGSGARFVGLITLVCMAACFAIGILFGRLEGQQGTPYMQVVLWMVSPGCALLVFCWTTAAMTRFLADSFMVDEKPSFWNELTTLVAVLGGIVAGALTLGMTAGALLGGALLGV